MKTKFFEQYSLTDEKLKEIWESGLVVFDTNILLNLYRYNKQTCDDILNYMQTFGDQLWMPFQVGWEYNNNRMEVAYKSQAACDVLSKRLDEDRAALEGFFKQNFHHHPYLQHKEFFKRYDRYVKLLRDYLEDLKENDNGYFDNDTILEKLGELYEGRVGDDYSVDELKGIYAEGKIRYAEKIPPGYKDNTADKRAAGERHLYGDLIVWKQIIRKAADTSKDVIFVSDDLKEDWMLEFRGKKYGPRKELIKEFHEQTNNHCILIYNQEHFLNFANEKFNAALKEETITEVKTVHQGIIDFYRDQIAPSILQSTMAMSSLDAYLKSMEAKTHFNLADTNIFGALDSYKVFIDSLQEQVDKMKAITEPLSQLSARASQLANIGRRFSLASVPGWIPDAKTGFYVPQSSKRDNDSSNEIDEIVE